MTVDPVTLQVIQARLAGIVGAYGNVGGVLFLTAYSFLSAQTFFMLAGLCAIVALISVMALIDEPKGHITEVMPDGSIALIDVT